MKNIKRTIIGVVLVVSLAGVSSASAANWDPQGTPITATQVGTATISFGATVSCAVGDTDLAAVGDLAATTLSSNPVRWSSCTNSISPLLSTSVSTAGTWTLTATSTTSVDLTAVNGSTPVITVTIGSPPLGCQITATSVHLTGNTWSNSTHRLTTNGGATFGVIDHNGICPGVTGSGTLAATFQLPTSATIT